MIRKSNPVIDSQEDVNSTKLSTNSLFESCALSEMEMEEMSSKRFRNIHESVDTVGNGTAMTYESSQNELEVNAIDNETDSIISKFDDIVTNSTQVGRHINRINREWMELMDDHR